MAILLSEIGPKSSIVSEMLVYNPLCLRARAGGEGGKGGCDRHGGRELRHSSTSLWNQDSQFLWIFSSVLVLWQFGGVRLKQYVFCCFFLVQIGGFFDEGWTHCPFRNVKPVWSFPLKRWRSAFSFSLKSSAYYPEYKVLKTRSAGVSDTVETWQGTL